MGEVRRRSPCRPAGQTPIWSFWWQAPRQLQQTLRLITLQPNLAHSEKQFFKEKSFTFRFFFSPSNLFFGELFFFLLLEIFLVQTLLSLLAIKKKQIFPKKIPQPPPHTMNYGLFCKANYSNVK